MRSANLDPDNVTRKRQRKFIKLEREVVRCGDDVQHLQRFVNAQAIGFRKILKKYRVCGLQPLWRPPRTITDLPPRNGLDLVPLGRDSRKTCYPNQKASFERIFNHCKTPTKICSAPSAPRPQYAASRNPLCHSTTKTRPIPTGEAPGNLCDESR